MELSPSPSPSPSPAAPSSVPHVAPSGELVGRLRARYGEAALRRQLESLHRHGPNVEDPVLWLETAVAGNFKYKEIERVERCLCGNADTRFVSRFVYWNLLGTRHCPACGLLFVSPRLTSDEVARLFSEIYFDHRDVEYWGTRRAPVFADVLRLLRRAGATSVLDVGCAYGHFVKAASDRGLRASGCDISGDAVRIGRERLGVRLHEGTVHEVPVPAGTVDAVVSLDALYYAHDPAADLVAMRRLVAPGGHLVLRLRNVRWSAARSALRRRERVGREVMPSEHLWGFSPRSIRALLDRLGWETIACEPAAYSRTGLHLLQTAAMRANRLGRVLVRQAPIWTRSFNVLARRPG
ncbi:MAG: class I SAM-dependent methyltransferase [Gemmatimonadaceae bacterium]